MYETQIAELREKLCKTELLLSDAQETANNLNEKDSTMKDKIEKLQRELDSTKMDTRRNVTSLQVKCNIVVLISFRNKASQSVGQ